MVAIPNKKHPPMNLYKLTSKLRDFSKENI
jgi:hypothetical protein